MLDPNRVLVVGGGVGGMSAAISLRKLGLPVDLVELDPQWKIYGAGITITGPTLRAFRGLGILEEVKRLGATWQRGLVCTPDGKPIAEVEWPAYAPGEPTAGGIMRPVLHGILSRTTRAAGVEVMLAVTVEDLRETETGAQVRLSNGEVRTYGLVIAADGVNSAMRQRLFPQAPRPAFTGQSVYRIVVARPPGLDGSRFYPRGDRMLGCSLVSATHMYMFLLLPMPGNPWLAPEQQPQHLYDAMAGWGDMVPAIREQVLHSPVRETINYRPLEPVMLQAPWHKGRVLLIGDAVHATTPHMASGAGMAVEDGMIIAEELARGGSLPVVLERFMQRRFERCRMVVENSVRLGQMEMRGESPLAHNELVMRTIAELSRAP